MGKPHAGFCRGASFARRKSTRPDEIRNHGSYIENRLIASDCTAAWLKKENQKIIDGFRRMGEQIILINDDYGKVMTEILNG